MDNSPAGDLRRAGLIAAVALTGATIRVLAEPPNEASFEVVWRTVHEQHFDPSFGGLD